MQADKTDQTDHTVQWMQADKTDQPDQTDHPTEWKRSRWSVTQ